MRDLCTVDSGGGQVTPKILLVSFVYGPQVGSTFLLVGGVTCCPEESADILGFRPDLGGWRVYTKRQNELFSEISQCHHHFCQEVTQLNVPRHGHVVFGLKGTPPPALCGDPTTSTTTSQPSTPSTSSSSSSLFIGAPTSHLCLLLMSISICLNNV